MTTPTEDARAALAAFDRAGADTVLTRVPAIVDALRALIEPTTDDDREVLDLDDVREVFQPSDLWDGDDDEQSIILRFIAQYSALDRAIGEARRDADYEDDAQIWFQWDAESDSLRLRRQVSHPEPVTDAEVEAARKAHDTAGLLRDGDPMRAALEAARAVR